MNDELYDAGLIGSKEKFTHLPVLPREVVRYLSFGDRPVRLIDGTVGSGGHSGLLLEANPNAVLLGIDRDGEALKRAGRRLEFAGDRVKLVHGEFGDIAGIAAANGFAGADGILLDIGVSSPQIDDPSRGFSWRNDGPLDMRMDAESGISAAELLNSYPEERLSWIFHEWGEIRSARKLAAAVAARRKTQAFSGTAEFADFCENVLGRTPRGVLPLPTLVFQALRIAVNDELGQLERGLAGALATLCSGGVMTVISFHSLEDRMVKNFLRDAARGCICPPDFPVCRCGHRPEVELLTRKAVMAQDDELAVNRRSAPARLRAARKTDFLKKN